MSSLDKFKSTHAWYQTTVPSTGQKIHYRAMIMKESMELSLALTENNESGIETTLTILEECLKEKNIDLRDLPLFDIEWILLQTQRKSQGEEKEIIIKCEHCETENETSISIDTIRISGLEESKKHKIIQVDKHDGSGSTFIELKYPTMQTKEIFGDSFTEDMIENDMKSYFAGLVGVFSRSINRIYDESDSVDSSEVSEEELEEFVLGLDSSALTKFSEFFASIPKTVLDLEFNCKKCNGKNKKEVSDIKNFF